METLFKEVYFDKYCEKCEYRDAKEEDDPCYDCLGEPVREYSHKPVNFKERV